MLILLLKPHSQLASSGRSQQRHVLADCLVRVGESNSAVCTEGEQQGQERTQDKVRLVQCRFGGSIHDHLADLLCALLEKSRPVSVPWARRAIHEDRCQLRSQDLRQSDSSSWTMYQIVRGLARLVDRSQVSR